MFAIADLRPVILSHIAFGVASIGHCDTLQGRKVHAHIKKKGGFVLFCFNLGKDMLLEPRQREPEIVELELQVL